MHTFDPWVGSKGQKKISESSHVGCQTILNKSEKATPELFAIL